MWFETLFGFAEGGPEEVRRRLVIEDGAVVNPHTGWRIGMGTLDTPTLATLREAVSCEPVGPNRVREQVADVAALHADPANAGATFQAASQFNLLEMPSPAVTPAAGITGYVHDRTQGPACALSAAGGLLYRHHLVPVDGGVGQTAARQLDMLADLGEALGQVGGHGPLWHMRNGYALLTPQGLARIGARLATASEAERDALRGRLRVGVHRDVTVTPRDPVGVADHGVTQVYAAALPVAYGEGAPPTWEPLARLVVEAAYEATLLAAALGAEHGGSRRVYLTLLGGGVFGNPRRWILDAMTRAVRRHRDRGLDIVVVSHGRSDPEVAAWAASVDRIR